MLCFCHPVSPSPLHLLSDNTSERRGYPGHPGPLSAFHVLSLRPISKCLGLTKTNPPRSIFLSVIVFLHEVPTLSKAHQSSAPLLPVTLSSFPDASDTLPATASNPRHVRKGSSRLYSCPSGTSYGPGCLPWGWIQTPGPDRTGHTTSLFEPESAWLSESG